MSGIIDESSIMNKLTAYAKSDAGKKKMSERIDELRQKRNTPEGLITEGGSLIITYDVRDEYSYRFISILRRIAEKLSMSSLMPDSITDIFYSLDIVGIENVKKQDGTEYIIVDISFDGRLLPRVSLYNNKNGGVKVYTGSGIDNIVSLFDTGYSIENEHNVPSGYWQDHEHLGRIRAKRQRDGLMFMRKAIDEFNSEYGHIAIASFSGDVDGFYARW